MSVERHWDATRCLQPGKATQKNKTKQNLTLLLYHVTQSGITMARPTSTGKQGTYTRAFLFLSFFTHNWERTEKNWRFNSNISLAIWLWLFLFKDLEQKVWKTLKALRGLHNYDVFMAIYVHVKPSLIDTIHVSCFQQLLAPLMRLTSFISGLSIWYS